MWIDTLVVLFAVVLDVAVAVVDLVSVLVSVDLNAYLGDLGPLGPLEG